MQKEKMSAGIRAAGLAGLLWLLGLILPAEAAELRTFLVSGFFNFKQPEFRELYGPMPVLGLTFDLYSRQNFGLGFGVVGCRGRGEALTVEGEPVLFPLKFYRWTFPLLLKYRLVTGRFQLAAGAGLAFSVYDESWVGVDLAYHGQKIHFRAELATDVRLARRVYLRSGLVWDSIPTGVSSQLLNGGRAKLDGLSLEAGLGYGF